MIRQRPLKNGSGAGKGQLGGRRVNKNTKPCPGVKTGRGRGKGKNR